ncbi:hypothetical protein [Roseibacillus ishigakijimensis]|uniref:Tetratricopeptide repeat-containing protein n=1 Tax=Roseibacillus ishigakijimensis TaxID=454146 RepID=A0A934RS10_9BACT|nr:hypothetical protein [Roseibacillus ishigakijimensis]MBK1834867.1 hypothetical protein [Roseibacillus ishigakijimensis]
MKVLGILLLALTLPLPACYWDRDTLRAELGGHLDTVKTLVGWFDRYPPLYYEMRLARVTAELAKNPEKAALYDDAAVACDRLGRSDEAIAWMEKKQRRAEEEAVAPGAPTTRYKTLANLGTFHAHRWLSAKKADPATSRADLDRAISFIEQAIAEYPAAHFNREKYQLEVLQWLGGDENRLPSRQEIFPGRSSLTASELAEREAGFLGLIQLGAAWESPDLFLLLQKVYLAQERAHPRLLANLRVAELLHDGKTLLHPGLKPLFRDPAEISNGSTFLEPPAFNQTLAYFEKARRATEERDQARGRYLQARLTQGQHPDTDPDFWQHWQEPAFPPLPVTLTSGSITIWIFAAGGVLILALVPALRWKKGLSLLNPQDR